MDLLKRELERKKKSVQKAKANAGGGRFFRAGDLRRQQEEGEDEEKEEERRRKRKLADEVDEPSSSNNKHRAVTKKSGTSEAREGDGESATNDSDFVESSGNDGGEAHNNLKLSLDEITNRLRMLGYPIKLFGETTGDRVKRLRKALDEQKNLQAGLSEMEEFRLGRGHGIRNPFLEKDNKTKRTDDHAEATDHGNKKEGDDTKDDDNELDENDPHKRVYKYFKGLIKTWEADLNERPESVKRSVAGRNETKTMKQCKDYIRPLFKLCKNRRVDEGILTKLNRIVSFCLEEEFVKAHDTYIDISIGRAAWPIGVTMVGIHARTGRAKIESSNVAHVMNSELQRKYLTSVKRLMSYAQKKSNADPSKKVL
jgi:pre-mRNA-splicing factor 18